MQERLTKSDLLMLLHFAHQQEQAMIASLTEVERNVTGVMDHWVAKDFITNILLWKQLQTQKLTQVVNGETPPVWTDMELVHHINSEGFLRFQNRSFQEVQVEAARVFEAFIAQVEDMSEEELNDPHHFAQQEGEPLCDETVGNGLLHPCTQLTTYYLQYNKRKLALQLQENMLEAVRNVAFSPEMLGAIIYNQVCFYATNGWPERATILLPEALKLRPTLIEWSKHDSDLDTLRTNSAFQAIFESSELQAPVNSLIDPQELHASSTKSSFPLVVDVRDSTEYAKGHISGAINIPLNQLKRSLTGIPKDRIVVTYCNMHHRGESRGERAATQLRAQGYQAYTLDGGYPAWKVQGFPIDEIAEDK